MTINNQLSTINSSLERYLALGNQAGCPPDQMDNFFNAGIVLQERQLAASAAARLCDHPDGPTAIGYGGARGGGKSHWLLAQMGADDCQRVPGLKCLLLRKVGKANMEHFEDLRRRLFGGLDHEFSAYRGVLTFSNGSRIVAGHFQNEKDIDSYLGLEYDIIGIEEATTLSLRKYTDISTCCRSSKTWTPPAPQRQSPSASSTDCPLNSCEAARSLSTINHQQSTINPLCPPQPSTLNTQSIPWRPRIYSTTNPGGVGHAWYKRLFIDPHRNRLRSPSTSPSCEAARSPSTINNQPSTIFIPAKVGDNAFNNPEYRRVLEGLTGWQKRAWLDGSWDIAAGQYFTTFRRDIHIVTDPPAQSAHQPINHQLSTINSLATLNPQLSTASINHQLSTINYWDDSRAVEWFAAMDYGHVHYTVCLLGCRDGDGNTFVVDEHAERLWLPQRHAAAIKAMLARHGVSLSGSQTLNPQLSTLNYLTTLNPQPARVLARFVAGADVFSRQSDGTTIAEQYAKHGIKLRCANTDRINGWAEILQLLGDPASCEAAQCPSTINNQLSTSLRPRLFFHQKCARLIETLPILQHDPNRPEDVLKVDADEDGNGGDDAADCLRYLVATKPRIIIQRKLRGL